VVVALVIVFVVSALSSFIPDGWRCG